MSSTNTASANTTAAPSRNSVLTPKLTFTVLLSLGTPSGSRWRRQPLLGRPAQLVVQRHERQPERPHGLVVRDHVVARFEHLQEVAGQGDVPGQALRQERVDLHQ